MSDFSDLTSRFRVAVLHHDRARVTKRNRLPVSCSNCRSRRMKCDRKQPCTSCTKRKLDSSCNFASSAQGEQNDLQRLSHGMSPKSKAALRLQDLERTVSGLIQTPMMPTAQGDDNNSSSGLSGISSTATQSHLMANPDQNSGAGGSSGYAGSTNWRSVLSSIQGIRSYLDVQDGSFNEDTPPTSLSDTQEPVPDFSSNSVTTDTLDEIPDRPTVDTLLMTYFNARYVTVSFIHVTHFQEQYASFWKNPSGTPHLWISLLCSMLCLGSVVALSRKDPIGTLLDKTAPATFAEKARKYMVSGRYLTQKPYAVESLLLHSFSKYWFTTDKDSDIWTDLGLVTRLAQKMGYHRDPSLLEKPLSPFQAEMRRRTWNFVEVFDVLASLQLGMPPVIQEDEYGPAPPSNLQDEDFDESSIVLPPSRSPSDHTSVAYMLCKSRVARVFRKIIHVVLMNKLNRLLEVVEPLNQELEAAHDLCPYLFRIRPVKTSGFTDQPYIVVQRMLLELLYLKAKCVLHRDFLGLSDEYIEYKTRAKSAALRVLELQFEYHNESQVGGRLEREDWVLTSLTMHDFLLAAMVVCLDVSMSPSRTMEELRHKIRMLRSSYFIWRDRKSSNPHAAHATEVLAAMLTKLQNESNTRIGPGMLTAERMQTINSELAETHCPSALMDLSMAMTDHMLTHDTYEFSEMPSLNCTVHQPTDPAGLNGLLRLNSNDLFDWNTIDRYLLDNEINHNMATAPIMQWPQDTTPDTTL